MTNIDVHDVRKLFIEPVVDYGAFAAQHVCATDKHGGEFVVTFFFPDTTMALEPREVHYGNHRRGSCDAAEGHEACACD